MVTLRPSTTKTDRTGSFSPGSTTIASVYAAKAGGTAAAWRELMIAETWYTADETVAAGLADRTDTVPDAGPTETAGTDPFVEGTDVEDAFDLSRFQYAGRSKAPTPGHPKPPAASADGLITTQEGSPAVAFSDEQLTSMRQKLGTAEDADEATILAALHEALDEQTDPPVVPATPVVSAGQVVIEADVLDGLRAQATQGAAARTQQLDEHRDRTITAAIADGKITPARKDHWVTSWAADAEGTELTLKALAPGLVPVDERGHDQSTVTGSAYDDLYGNTSKEA